MAGDWIPFDHDLPDKEEVIAISAKTGASIAETVLRLCRLWCWFDRHTLDGKMKRIGNAGVTLKCGGDAAFWEAVAEVGWVRFQGDDVSIPGFSERFGDSARRRLLTAKRVTLHRLKRKCNATTVTAALQNASQEPQPQPLSESIQEEPPLAPKGALSYSQCFEDWWTQYPKQRRVAKQAAYKAYQKAGKTLVKRGMTREAAITFLLARVVEFAASPAGQSDVLPNPATWLNGGRYDDDLGAIKAPGGNGNSPGWINPL